MEIYATLTNLVEDKGRLKVIAYRKSNTESWRLSAEEIETTFKGEYVTCGNFTKGRHHHASNPEVVFHYDNVIIDRQEMTRYSVFQTAGYRKAVTCLKTTLPLYDNGEVIMSTVQTVVDIHQIMPNAPFYVEHGDYTFGPFFSDEEGNASTRGTQLAYYWSTKDVGPTVSVAGSQYLLTKPRVNKGGKLHAYTSQDVFEWYNSRVSADLQLSVDQKKEIQRLADTTTGQEEDGIIAKKLEAYIHQFDILPDAFAKLLAASTQAQKWARQNLEDIARVISKEVDELYQHEEDLNNQIALLKSEREELATVNQQALEDLAIARTQLESETVAAREKLVDELEQLQRIQNEAAELQEYNALLQDEFAQGKERTFREYTREEIKKPEVAISNSDDEFIYQVEEYCETRLKLNLSTNVARELLAATRSSYCIMTQNIGSGTALAWASAASKLYVATAEYNWLSFTQFKDQILGKVVREAIATPRYLVVLVLQSFNNSAPAYLLPLLNHFRGAVSCIPGTQIPWPDNLRLFLTPATSAGETATGLPVEISMFEGTTAGASLVGQNANVAYDYDPEYAFTADFFSISLEEPQGFKVLEKCCHG